MYLNISLWGGCFFFFQSQANQIPFFCFLSRKWQTFSNYRRLWASAWKFILVFSCCFSHAIFSLQEMPRTYWYCGWSWKLPSLPWSCSVLLPTPGLYEAQQCCSDVGGHTGSVPGNVLPASQPWGACARGTRSRQSPGAAGHLGSDLSFEKVTFGKPPSLPGLALTCLPPSSGLPGAF